MKCIVKDCENHSHQGGFSGDLCNPCYNFITTGEGRYSQAYRNTKREWVGLTRGEEAIIIEEWRWLLGRPSQLCRMVEDKLKEKNTCQG